LPNAHELLREADVQIYCMGVGDVGSGNSENMEYPEPSGLEILEWLARGAGGRAFFRGKMRKWLMPPHPLLSNFAANIVSVTIRPI